MQVIMTGRRRHFYLYDLAGSSVARVAHIAGISDSSLETFAVSPASQVSSRQCSVTCCAEGYRVAATAPWLQCAVAKRCFQLFSHMSLPQQAAGLAPGMDILLKLEP